MNHRIGWVLALAASWTWAAATLPLGEAANSSRIDGVAGDGKGGWIDRGSHDLHVLAPGRQKFAMVDFDIPATSSENDRTCIVLSKAGACATLAIPDPALAAGRNLFLLHACADPGAKREMAAHVTMLYADGTSSELHVRYGRDVADWEHPRGGRNCARAWTQYNHNTQVSLFVSQFAIDASRKLTGIVFKNVSGRPWMIVAATLAHPRAHLPALASDLRLEGHYEAPPAFPFALEAARPGARPKNVILIIGDGMGRGEIDLQSLYVHRRLGGANFAQFPVATLCTTYSANSSVTDSSAAGTAFATGEKTSNGVLALQVLDEEMLKKPKMLVSTGEKAHAKGLSLALVTQDSILGATPAVFYAHALGRNEGENVAAQAGSCGYEVLIGNAGGVPFFQKRSDGRDLISEMVKRGYAYCKSQKEFDAVPANQKVIGLWNTYEGDRTLEAMVKTALNHVKDNPKGFFMMAECYNTDKGAHANNPEISVLGVTQVEWMVKEAVEFARARGDTLVVVTADHETGGVSAIASASNPKSLHLHYGDTSHTGSPVALFAYGPGSERFDRMLDNTDIAKIIQELLNL